MAVDLLEQILPHLRNASYRSRRLIQDWKLKEGDLSGAHSTSLRDRSWKTTQIPFQWIGDNKIIWFRKEIIIPPEFAGKQLALLLDLQEALLYVDGKLYHGLDQQHKEVLLTEKARANQTFTLAIQSFSGRKRGTNSFNNAELVIINRTARALYNGLTALRDLDKLVGHPTQESKDIRELMRRTLIFLKYFKPEGEEYPNAIGRAHRFLTSAVENEFRTSNPFLVHLVGQTHIDVAWLWTQHETARKLGRTLSTMLKIMDEFPETRFTQSSAFLHTLAAEQYSELAKQTKQRILEGRLEVVTPMWVEPDCHIAGGESLVRQILYGKRFFKNELNSDSSIAWLPHSPGFPASMPQILLKAGIPFFFTMKLLLNDTTRFPHNTFWWKGIDGTRILSHVPPVGLEGQLNPETIKRTYEGFQQKETSNLALQTYGGGEENGGPTIEQVEIAKVLKSISGLPNSQLSTAKDFFAQAEQQADNLPTWDNELYLEKHRGTYTTQAWIKAANRECEALLYNSELLASLNLAYGNSPKHRQYPQEELHNAWLKLLQNQAHEVISGTSIAEVYEIAKKDFEEIRVTAHHIISRAGSAFLEPARKNSREFSFSVFNPLPFDRDEYVEVNIRPNEKSYAVVDGDGHDIEHQILGRSGDTGRLLCYLPRIPAMSGTSFIVRPSPEKTGAAAPWRMTLRIVETPFYKIRMDKKGGMSSIYDKQLRRELVERGKRANLLQPYRDTPEQWDAWELDRGFERQKLDLFQLKSSRFAESGPLRARVKLDFRSANGSSIIQEIMLYHKRKRIDFHTRVLWREQRTLLKAVFPLNIKANSATYEIQFGAVKRTTRPREDVDKAKYEVPAQQWADMSEQKLGVSLLNNSKYGYDASENVLRLTLIRSPLYPHPNDPWHLNDDKCTDQGEHHFIYSLYPHPADWKKGETVIEAHALNRPVLMFPNELFRKMNEPLLISKRNIMVSSMKKAEDSDDLVLRLYESQGDQTDCTVRFDFSVKSAAECDLLEADLKELKITKGKLALRFKPFEIKTLKLGLRKK